jgi:hypothetical protein
LLTRATTKSIIFHRISLFHLLLPYSETRQSGVGERNHKERGLELACQGWRSSPQGEIVVFGQERSKADWTVNNMMAKEAKEINLNFSDFFSCFKKPFTAYIPWYQTLLQLKS